MDKPQIILHSDKSLNYTPFDVKWIPVSAKVAVLGSHAKGTGVLQVYELCDGELQLIADMEKESALKCGTFGASRLESRAIATCDFDGNLEILDLTQQGKSTFSTKAHSQIINSVDGIAGHNTGRGAPELVTGSRDGTVKVWDPRQEKPVVSIEPESEDEKRDCWSVAFGNAHSPQERCVCAAFDNGDVKLFDLRTNSLRWETSLKNGVCSIQFDRNDIQMNKLVATTLEGNFNVYDLRTYHPKKGFASVSKNTKEKCTVWCVRHLPQNRDLFVTTSGNGSINLWKYTYPSSRTKELEDKSIVGVPGKVMELNNAMFSSQPVTNFDWSPDKTGLSACVGIDQTLKIVIFTKLNIQ